MECKSGLCGLSGDSLAAAAAILPAVRPNPSAPCTC